MVLCGYYAITNFKCCLHDDSICSFDCINFLLRNLNNVGDTNISAHLAVLGIRLPGYPIETVITRFHFVFVDSNYP